MNYIEYLGWMKHGFFILSMMWLLISLSGFGQTKFIEVRVQDSVQVPGDHFIYQLFYSRESYQEGGEDDLTNLALKLRLMDSLKAVLIRMKYSIRYLSSLDTLAVVNSLENQGPFIFITSKSLDSLSKLYGMLKKLSWIDAHVMVAPSSRQEDYQSRLQKKLLEAAYRKANQLAGFAKFQLKGILSITESDETAGWSVNPPLQYSVSTMPRRYYEISEFTNLWDDDKSHYPIYASYTVRYEVQ